MTEETTETLETTQAETQETPSEVSLLPEETQEPTGDAPIPEGLDAEIFDTETRTLREDKVVERLKQNQTDIERYKKQANDMRRKLSKGVDAPNEIEAYSENFVAEERYDFVIGDTSTEEHKHVNGVLSSLDKFAFEHGLSVETAKDLKNMYLRYAEDVKIIDGRSVEEKEKSRAEYIAEQKKILGEDADTIIKDNVRFFKEYGFFSDSEKKLFLNQMKESAEWNIIGMKMRKLFGENTSHDIPTRGVAVSGLADDETLAREYYDNKTSDTRRMQILQQRIDAGRSGGLPLVY